MASKRNKSLTILAAPYNVVGPVNAATGALAALPGRGHRVIFVVNQTFRGKLAAYGYEEHLIESVSRREEEKPGEVIARDLFSSKVFGPYSPTEKLQNFIAFCKTSGNYAEIEVFERGLKEAIERYRPDLIYADCGVLWPSIYYSGIPWVRQVSCTPISYIVDDEASHPPAHSGLPSNSDRSKWIEFNKLRRQVFVSPMFNDFIEKIGYRRYPRDVTVPWTQALTVYAYPEELNYEEVRKKEWFNLEVFQRVSVSSKMTGDNREDQLKKLGAPESFLNDTLGGKFSGKIVYLSLGSMGGYDLELMRRFVTILGATSHKYIVSKGPRHEEFSLAENMWGERYLPQTSILPLVDLVITHGGNNTVTEVFALGKPMIVFPIYSDQFDNAQRLDELGYGVRLHTYSFTEEQLLTAIEKLLGDEQLKSKLAAASERILARDRHQELAMKIEQMFCTESSGV